MKKRNIDTFSQLLNKKYGVKGTPTRNEYEINSESFRSSILKKETLKK